MRTTSTDFLGLSPALQLTLGGSVLLHVALLFGLPAPAAGGKAAATTVLQAQLAPTAAPRAVVVEQPRPVVKPAPLTPVAHSIPVDEPPPAPPAAPAPAPAAPAEASTVQEAATAYYSAAQLDSPPRLLGELQQVYPARARAAEVEGWVTLALLINERGEVEDVSVVKSHPAGYFEEAALNMLRKQRFTPPIKQNRAVKSRWLTTVRYRLQS